MKRLVGTCSWGGFRLEVQGPEAALSFLSAYFSGYSEERKCVAASDARVTIEDARAAPAEGAHQLVSVGPAGEGAADVHWSKGRRHLHIRMRGESGGSLLVAVRAVRALLASLVQERGAVVVHAAAFRTAEGACCLLGDKRQGKTTGLLAGLRAGAAMIANDSVFLEATAEGLIARGLPVAACVRMSTVSLFEELSPLLPDPSTHHWENPAAADLASRGPAAKLRLPPSTLADAFGTQVAACAPVRRIVEVRVDPRCRQAALEPLHGGEARAVVERHRLSDPMEQLRTLGEAGTTNAAPDPATMRGVQISRLLHDGSDPDVVASMLLPRAHAV